MRVSYTMITDWWGLYTVIADWWGSYSPQWWFSSTSSWWFWTLLLSLDPEMPVQFKHTINWMNSHTIIHNTWDFHTDTHMTFSYTQEVLYKWEINQNTQEHTHTYIHTHTHTLSTRKLWHSTLTVNPLTPTNPASSALVSKSFTWFLVCVTVTEDTVALVATCTLKLKLPASITTHMTSTQQLTVWLCYWGNCDHSLWPTPWSWSLCL